MKVMNKELVKEAKKKYSDIRKPVDIWVKFMEENSAKNYQALKSFPWSIDRVGSCYVFDMKGNNYRVITKIDFNTQRLVVKHILTHAEYDKEKWKRGCTHGESEKKARREKS